MPPRAAPYARRMDDVTVASRPFRQVDVFAEAGLLGNPVAVVQDSWRGGPRAVANPWRALTIEWQVSSPPPIFNFDGAPRVVGGPYNYGQPGAKHVVFDEAPAVAHH